MAITIEAPAIPARHRRLRLSRRQLAENRRRFRESRIGFQPRMPRKPQPPYRLRSRSVPEPPIEPEEIQVPATRANARSRSQQPRTNATTSGRSRSVRRSGQRSQVATSSRSRSRSTASRAREPVSLAPRRRPQAQASTSRGSAGNKLYNPKKPPGTPEGACNFCFSLDKDFHLGPMGTSKELKAHMFCLYFAAGLTQDLNLTGDGMFFFRNEDIHKELKRASFLKCSYCGIRGAAVGCAVKKCPIAFHMPCGYANNVFFNHNLPNFPAFCKNHRPKLSVPSFKGNQLCTICQEDMQNKERDKMVYVKCCKSYFHYACVEEFTYHSGILLSKCPNCQNREGFASQVKAVGIYIPDRLPTMDMDPPQFIEPQIRFVCCATECRCADGREHNGQDEWELYSCDRCGSQAIHIFCAGNPPGGLEEWICDLCEYIEHHHHDESTLASSNASDISSSATDNSSDEMTDEANH